MATVEQRLRRIERVVLLAIVGWTVGLAGLVQPERKPKTMKMEQFELVDRKGKIRALWALEKDGPVLVFLDAQGKERFRIGTNESGTRLDMLNSKGESRVFLMTDDQVPTMLSLGYGKASLMATVDDDTGMIAVSDKAGVGRATFGLDVLGASLTLGTEQGQRAVTIGTDADGPNFSLWDSKGNSRAMFFYDPKDGPGMLLFDDNDVPRLGAQIQNGQPGFTLAGPEGKPVWSARDPAVPK